MQLQVRINPLGYGGAMGGGRQVKDRIRNSSIQGNSLVTSWKEMYLLGNGYMNRFGEKDLSF